MHRPFMRLIHRLKFLRGVRPLSDRLSSAFATGRGRSSDPVLEALADARQQEADKKAKLKNLTIVFLATTTLVSFYNTSGTRNQNKRDLEEKESVIATANQKIQDLQVEKTQALAALQGLEEQRRAAPDAKTVPAPLVDNYIENAKVALGLQKKQESTFVGFI